MPSPCPSPFPTSSAIAQTGANIAGVVRADLERSGLFRPLDQKGFAERITDINKVPTFSSWRSITAQGLVTGQVTQPGWTAARGFPLWDIYGESQMLGLQFFTTPENWRRIAHMVSDAIYERITGEKGYFDTRIVFISESGPAHQAGQAAGDHGPGRRQSHLPHQWQLYGADAALQSHGADDRLYVLYRHQAAGLSVRHRNGKQEMLGNFPNMTFSPRFSPDGNRVALTLETHGNSDIYVMDLRNRAFQRLTTDPGIDTAPSFSPDGSRSRLSPTAAAASRFM
jgi:TolB protein